MKKLKAICCSIIVFIVFVLVGCTEPTISGEDNKTLIGSATNFPMQDNNGTDRSVADNSSRKTQR